MTFSDFLTVLKQLSFLLFFLLLKGIQPCYASTSSSNTDLLEKWSLSSPRSLRAEVEIPIVSAKEILPHLKDFKLLVEKKEDYKEPLMLVFSALDIRSFFRLRSVSWAFYKLYYEYPHLVSLHFNPLREHIQPLRENIPFKITLLSLSNNLDMQCLTHLSFKDCSEISDDLNIPQKSMVVPQSLLSFQQGLQENKSLRKLKFIRNQLSEKDLGVIRQVFPVHVLDILTHFFLEGSDLSDMDISPLLGILGKSKNLVALSLKDNQMNNSQMQKVLDQLLDYQKLYYLNLGNNSLNHKNVETLVKIVKNNSQLQALDLQSVGLQKHTQTPVMKRLGEMQQSCPVLKYLWLDSNYLTDTMLSDFIDPTGHYANCHLIYLSLRNNLLQTCDIFEKGEHISIETLVLKKNKNLLPEGINNIGSFLANTSTLINLDFSDCNLQEAHGIYLKASLKKNSCLRRLDLSDNEKLKKESFEILESMVIHPSLEYLNLDESIDDYAYEADEIKEKNSSSSKVIVLDAKMGGVENLNPPEKEYIPGGENQ